MNIPDTERIQTLRDALAGVMELIDSGMLVRNTRHDSDPGWAITQIPLVQKLYMAQLALEREK
jgi:hypothetical protein